MTLASATSRTSAHVACSIIIPTRDQLQFLRPCVESILQFLTDQAVEIIIVDNGSSEDSTLDYLASLRADTRFNILQWQKPFNFSAINNFAAQHCQGDILCFLNNDIEIRDPNWLDKLLPLAARQDVGAVGCVLLYPNATIQHGGIALHAKAIAKHIAVGETADFFTRHSLSSPCAVDAVTAACLLIRKELYLRMGGFNANKLGVAFNDVDLCLRLGEKGLPVLLHPGVQLIHHESISRKSDDLPSNRARAEKEHAYMRFRWQYRLSGQHYTGGLPAGIAQQLAEPGLDSLDALIAQATMSLYLGRHGSADPLAAIDEELENAADTWQKHYLRLQADFENLKAHALRMEQAHKLIENSIFWRMTAPLRWLKRKITREGNRPPALIGIQAAQVEVDNVAQPIQSTAAPDPDKQDYDYRAKKQFSTFLQAGNTLSFPQDTRPLLSIILVFYNQAHLSLLCLQSILKHADVSYELVLVDNNSTDATDALLQRIEHATIIRNRENLGFVKAVNQGAAQCRGEFVLLLNNDASLESGALSSAIAVFDSEPNTGAVGGMIKLLDGSLQEAGSIIWNDGACLGYGRGADPLRPEFQFRREVDYCSGAFLLFRKGVFDEVHGFDEAYAPAYYEESDFCVRLQEQKLRIIYNPGSCITHYEFASSGGLQGASKLQSAHRELFCEKHPEFLARQFPNSPVNILAARSRNTHANVLVIDDRVPHPSLGAGYPRAANILNALSKLQLNVSFYPLLFVEDDWATVYGCLSPNIEVLLNSGKSGLQNFLVERQGFYQYIMISRCHNMEYFNFIVNLVPNVIQGAKIIYDAEAVTAPRDFLKLQILGTPLAESDKQTLLKKELEQARIADLVVTVSERESAIFQQSNFQNTLVIGHTIAPEPTVSPFDQRAGLLFVGALRDDASPNVDSLLWFIINVLPLIEQRIPGIELHVVGDNSAPSLATIEVDAVRFRGRMGNIDSLYNSCRVFIAPTRFAAGIPHKVHEAAAKGLPSVTTALLALQLGWQDEAQLLVADAAKDFAEQCVRLYQDQSVWEQVRQRGLDAIREDCSTTRFNTSLQSLFE